MLKGFRVAKDDIDAMSVEIRPLTTDPEVAAALRQALSPQPNGDAIIYVEADDAFAAIVAKYGTTD